MSPEWVSAIAEIAIALGLVLNVAQMRSDHDRSRREKAVDLMFNWSRETDRRAEAARRLGDVLDFQQARSVHLESGFRLDAQHDKLLKSVLGQIAGPKNGEIKVSARQSSKIRYYIVRYLNSLESVLAAWRHNVADRDMLYEQFAGFIALEHREYILENYRQAAGGKDAFPAIAHFVREIRDQKERADRNKPKIW